MAELPNSIVVVCDFHARKVLQNDPPLSGVIKVNKLGSLVKNVKREPPSGAIYGMVSHYGSCHFWYDNWLATGALFLRAPVVPNLSFRNFIINGHWDVNLLSQTLPRDIVSSILKFPIPEGEHADEVIWMHTSSGNFTLTSAFREARIVEWWLRSQDSAIRHFICLILPSITCWHIWKARNKAIFEGVQMRSAVICKAIFSEIKSIVEIHFKQMIEVQTFCQLFDWSISSVSVFEFKLVRWEAKEIGKFILNTDGCSKGNPGVGGGGGVLQDTTGLTLFSFSAFFGETTALRAEVLALLIDLQIRVQRGFDNLCVQSDLLVLVGILQRCFQCPWHIRKEVRQIWHLVDDPACFSHCYREANKAADALSNAGIIHPEQHIKVYDCFNMFPRLARGEIRLDRIGMPLIRKIRHTAAATGCG
ncbi:uncharacterized protein [Coffea arabica]|uniref:RNase H type-1 domain-containing protein n=1 Tax=Coffea arabica TaxID=13443 RepID=A0ABM4W0Y9_COFAR